jgi:putative tryptophan/tyrosine transport system substrate-binding protein
VLGLLSAVLLYETEMRRRTLLFLLGSAVGWPLNARAQSDNRKKRVGVIMLLAPDDPVAKVRIGTFRQALRELGWTEGENLQVDYRWSVGPADQVRIDAAQMAALAPDVLLATGSPAVAALQQTSRALPAVFVLVSDPVGAGFVDSLARPGGNATGFTNFEYGLSAKWLELLKEIAHGVTRVAVLRDTAIAAGAGQLGAMQSVSPSVGVELTPIGMRDPGQIEQAITAFARSPNGGLILTASALAPVYRDLIIRLAAQHKLPAVYYERYFVAAGGLASYGPDQIDQYRRAAVYVDRILRGEKAADLPVQAPTKYELVINLRAAGALGLAIPQSLLARADDVVE